jgi:hypothetical protein
LARDDRALEANCAEKVFSLPVVFDYLDRLLGCHAHPRLGAAEVKKLIVDGADGKGISGGRSIRLLNEARSFELARAARR